MAYVPAERPTMYFIGVTTSGSSIRQVFPHWAEYLKLNSAVLKGIDFAPHSSPAAYREAVEFIKQDPLSRGALVTSHKMDLFTAARDLFDELGPYAGVMGEVSSIAKEARGLVGRAKDPITSGLALERVVSPDFWEQSGAEVLLFGAGGSALALSVFLAKAEHGDNRPRRIVVTNRSQTRLDEMERVHRSIDIGIPVEYVLAEEPHQNDAVLATIAEGSLVVNATGLGKDAPGSPITDAAEFPRRAIAWDFNYRGDLRFLDQARHQRDEKGLTVEDGWVYFIYGWTQVIADVFGVEIPTSGKVFDDLSRIAADVKKRRE